MTSTEQWSAALDALEEWVRRLASTAPTEPAPELPVGQVPPGLRLRALVLHAEMLHAVTDGRSQLQQLAQQQVYAQV